MRLPDGSEIPDRPTDPEELRLWKTIYYTKLYGLSKERLAEYCATDARETERLMRTFTPLPWYRRLWYRLRFSGRWSFKATVKVKEQG